mmetsp:Transcript_27251/g.63530  ORF Transcript_27251/g.63530 Transcript_27251/m.63530 type:complete len:122 (+) Transcript_27251:1675-2040(+)
MQRLAALSGRYRAESDAATLLSEKSFAVEFQFRGVVEVRALEGTLPVALPLLVLRRSEVVRALEGTLVLALPLLALRCSAVGGLDGSLPVALPLLALRCSEVGALEGTLPLLLPLLAVLAS